MEYPELENDLDKVIDGIINDKSLDISLREQASQIRPKKRGRPRKSPSQPLQTNTKRGRPEDLPKRNLRLFLWVYFTLDIPNSGKMRKLKYRGNVEDWILDHLDHKDKTLLMRDKALWGKYLENDLPSYFKYVLIEIDGKRVKSIEDLKLLSEEAIRKLIANWVQAAIIKYK